MGYYTRVTGEFAIVPPLTWAEFKDSNFAPHNIDDAWYPSLILHGYEQHQADLARARLLLARIEAVCGRYACGGDPTRPSLMSEEAGDRFAKWLRASGLTAHLMTVPNWNDQYCEGTDEAVLALREAARAEASR